MKDTGPAERTHIATAATSDGRREVVCATNDFDTYRDTINNVYYPARLELVDPRARLSNAKMSAFRLSHMTIGVVHFGAEVSIDPGDVGGYHIDMPIAGHVATSCGGREIVAQPAQAAVYTPGEHTLVHSWAADATQVSVKIDRASLEGELSAMLGRPASGPIRFDLGFDLTSQSARRWTSAVQLLLETLTHPGPFPEPVVAHQVVHLERAVIGGLLVSQPHSMTEALLAGPQAGPDALRRAVEFVEAAPGAQHTVTDVARAAGVGVRQLQKLFRDHFGLSPAEYVRRVRLDRARADLLADGPDRTVADVAYRWGFNHLGRFAQHYERRFGETPSRTLRKG